MVLGPLALSAFGYFIVYLADWNTRRQRRLIDESEPVDAVVTSSRVGTTTPGKSTAKAAHVTFEYEYDGRTYQSTHIRPGGTKYGSTGGSVARARAGRYDPGDEVTAHVPRSDPRLGFLEDRVSARSHLVMKIIGWGIVVFGILLTLLLAIF